MLTLLIASILVSAVSVIFLGVNVISPEGIVIVVARALGNVGLAVVVALIPAGIYWLFKRKRMPGLTVAIWVLWGLIAVLSLAGNMMAR